MQHDKAVQYHIQIDTDQNGAEQRTQNKIRAYKGQLILNKGAKRKQWGDILVGDRKLEKCIQNNEIGPILNHKIYSKSTEDFNRTDTIKQKVGKESFIYVGLGSYILGTKHKNKAKINKLDYLESKYFFL